jgi:hypothetical protein
MTDDTNEKIARLVEPEPERDGDCDTVGVYTSKRGAWSGRMIPYGNGKLDWHPIACTESVDTSLRVIEARWDDPMVTLYSLTTPQEKRAELCVGDGTKPHIAEAATTAEALALALLAALEAEKKP